MVYGFYGLWYTLTASFVEYWTEAMTDFVLSRSLDIMQFFSWYRGSTVPNLSLVIYGINDLRKKMSE